MTTPTEIRYDKTAKVLHVTFDDGESFALPAELLRVESPSAEVQGHSPAQKQLVAGRRHVGIIGIEQIGHYAVKLTFDDLHDTGLYTWETLRRMGEEKDALWRAYLDALSAAGLGRDP
ncbi:MAG TPA: DUF971 domain-containing protein [Candidatus Sulfotelmatobacter sp.]|jgi:DUF971 family protein|nr:DUF971 domain-containing protein [Candidatus Sulfotelmatobacter sp.]